MTIPPLNIAVVGLGRLGACLAASLAVAGHRVHGVDTNPDAVAAVALNRANPEPLLNDYIDRSEGRLTSTLDLAAAVGQSEMTFVVVPTPSHVDGSFDSFAVATVVGATATAARPDHICVVCSTVSPGTMDKLAAMGGLPSGFALVYSPFFIALGSVIDDMAHPDFRLIGANSGDAARAVDEVLYSLGPAKVAAMGLTEAEIAKIAVNAFLVTKAAYADTIASASAHAGVDGRRVLAAVGLDSRIGRAFMGVGAVPGGPCLPRDAQALGAWLSRHHQPTDLTRAVTHISEVQVARVVEWCGPYQTVAVLGMAYKPGTPVTEASMGLRLAARLDGAGKSVLACDPSFTWPSAGEAVAEADAVVVCTAHEEYHGLDTGGKPTLDMWGVVAPTKNVTVWGRG